MCYDKADKDIHNMFKPFDSYKQQGGDFIKHDDGKKIIIN